MLVEGQALPRGAYGLHMIPNADSWTVIFSNNSTSWGSFTYDPNIGGALSRPEISQVR